MDCQICFDVFCFSDSCEICIPNESDNASEIAIVIIPVKIIVFERVEYKPTIKPNVVIIAEVKPKEKPSLKGCFISN